MNVIYIHVCCINNYKEVFTGLMSCIKDSGLYNHVKEIRCCILGEYDETLFQDEKIVIRATSPDISLYEVFTVSTLYHDCKKENFNVLYLHTKGVSKPTNEFIKDWTDMMCYFNIYKFETCIQLLENNDSVGVNLLNSPECHYSGNFWWSKSSYINRLDECVYTCYNSPEFWLNERRMGRYVSLWNSYCYHYAYHYPKECYENKLILPTMFDFTS
jgi:hypothetical protein